jgi:serine/threonine protein kinase
VLHRPLESTPIVGSNSQPTLTALSWVAGSYNCDVLIIGSTISHHRIVKKLGEGGMGAFDRAEDTDWERAVALKFLAEHLLNDEEAKTRFLREANLTEIIA